MVYIKATDRRIQAVTAARRVLSRDGVGATTLRAVSTEADMPLGTLHYAFPSKELLIKAVIEDVMEEISAVLRQAADVGGGLENTIRRGLQTYWAELVEDRPEQTLIQHELFIYALRTPGLEHLSRWQVENYSRIVAAWCQEAAGSAGEICAVPFDTLGRLIVASNIGVVLQYLADPDLARARRDIEAVIEMVIHLAGVRSA